MTSKELKTGIRQSRFAQSSLLVFYEQAQSLFA
jgi:hypothetical protein